MCGGQGGLGPCPGISCWQLLCAARQYVSLCKCTFGDGKPTPIGGTASDLELRSGRRWKDWRSAWSGLLGARVCYARGPGKEGKATAPGSGSREPPAAGSAPGSVPDGVVPRRSPHEHDRARTRGPRLGAVSGPPAFIPTLRPLERPHGQVSCHFEERKTKNNSFRWELGEKRENSGDTYLSGIVLGEQDKWGCHEEQGLQSLFPFLRRPCFWGRSSGGRAGGQD